MTERCRATYTASWGETARCTSEEGHTGKHVSLFTDEDPNDPMDAIWKDSDRGAGRLDG